MNLKNKVGKLERLLINQGIEKSVVSITAYSESEFEEKRIEYLKTNPQPELFVFVQEFTYHQILNNLDNGKVDR